MFAVSKLTAVTQSSSSKCRSLKTHLIILMASMPWPHGISPIKCRTKSKPRTHGVGKIRNPTIVSRKDTKGKPQPVPQISEKYKKLSSMQQAKSEAKQQAQHHPSKETQVQLGYRYLLGQQGVPRDPAKAVELWTAAAAADSAVAQYHLGWAHWFGLGLTKNETKGKQLMLQAATRLEELKELATQRTQGDSMAMFCVAHIYNLGQGVQTNEKLAVEWYKKAAGAGNALAQFSLGVCYHNGQGVQQDFKKAVEWFTKAAEAGYALAQFSLGVCYENGQGVQQDFKKAVEWYTKAAEAGNALAQENLGECYENGQGVQQDFKKAVEWFTKAAEAGNAPAQNNLGECYENGQGVQQDFKKAVEWYTKAAEAGDADAQNNLGECYENGQGVQQDSNKARLNGRSPGDITDFETNNKKLIAMFSELSTAVFNELEETIEFVYTNSSLLFIESVKYGLQLVLG
eukprot:g40318.t1